MLRFRPTARLVAALLVAAALALPASAQPRLGTAPADAASRIARATHGLTLTPDQQQTLSALAGRHDASAPGATWRLAAEVARVLTPAQTAQLQQRAAERRSRAGARPDGRRAERRHGDRPSRERAPDARPSRERAGRHASDARTAAQRDALRDAHTSDRAQREALTEQFRSGALSAEAFTAARERLHADRRARIEALLTPEQRQAHAAMEARRDAERQARADVLGLTAEQQAAAEARALDRLRTAPARGERPQRDDADAILTPEQQAIVTLHHALGGDRMHRMRGDRHDGPRRRPARDRVTDR